MDEPVSSPGKDSVCLLTIVVEELDEVKPLMLKKEYMLIMHSADIRGQRSSARFIAAASCHRRDIHDAVRDSARDWHFALFQLTTSGVY